MASTEALAKRLDKIEERMTAFEKLAKGIIEASEIATKAYQENRLPIEREFGALKTLVDAQVRNLRERVKALEGCR
jgi:hypothetical protein